MHRFLLSADVGRLLGITPAAVRQAANTGRLPVAAVTEGGVRLFALERIEDVAGRTRQAGEESPCVPAARG